MQLTITGLKNIVGYSRGLCYIGVRYILVPLKKFSMQLDVRHSITYCFKVNTFVCTLLCCKHSSVSCTCFVFVFFTLWFDHKLTIREVTLNLRWMKFNSQPSQISSNSAGLHIKLFSNLSARQVCQKIYLPLLNFTSSFRIIKLTCRNESFHICMFLQ